MKYAIVAKKDEYSYQVELRIKTGLNAAGWIYDKKHPNLVICVGGDGTLLYAVHKYIEQMHNVAFIGIHTGTLGFFTDYTAAELDQFLEDVLTKDASTFSSKLLQIEVEGLDKVFYALNEMRIENVIKTQKIDVYIDDEFFETSSGSGICLSTQAGSTGYNRSLRGAVIDSGLSLLQLAEITPIQHSKFRSLNNPYVMLDTREIRMEGIFSDAFLCYDHLHYKLDGVTKIHCKMSDLQVRFARYREYSYLKRLKNLY